MGKPYATELDAMLSTYSWARLAEVRGLANWVRSSADFPLLAVGSGGSLSSAHFAAFLHTQFNGRVAKAVTPLELLHSPVYLPDVALLLVTAGGGNPDILSGTAYALRHHPGRLGIVCGRKGSAVAEMALREPGAFLEEFDLPAGKDGFLATNSLLATSVLLTRAYALAFSAGDTLPTSLAELLHPGMTEKDFRTELDQRCRPLWGRDTLVVLHGNATLPAAIDLESKFTEAAIAHVQLADYRNFAHGRHNWLARHGAAAAVLALSSHEDASLADRTIKLLPDSIPTAKLAFANAGLPAALGALATAIYIAGLAGPARGIDPGRPRVPHFGRKLYHLSGLRRPSLPDGMTDAEATAIERKARAPISALALRGQLSEWREAYAAFRHTLNATSFRAIVLDYDGTLCGIRERFDGPTTAVAAHLTRLLSAGVCVGIATGRGKSVRKDLQRTIHKKTLWKRVLIAYHNGGELGSLADDAVPSENESIDPSLRSLADELRAQPRLSQLVKCEARLKQVTLELANEAMGDDVWELVQRAVRLHGPAGVITLRSSHSVDILAPGVSKRALVERITEDVCRAKGRGAVLCIGDKGRWPGNDFDLLDGEFSLSVDEVSSDPRTCWNLAPAGIRCVDAILAYFERMQATSGILTINT